MKLKFITRNDILNMIKTKMFLFLVQAVLGVRLQSF